MSLFGREAVRALGRHRLRSALAAIGIMFGIAAVVLVVAIGTAGSERAQLELHKLGDNLVWIEAGGRNVNGVRTGTHGTTSLTMDDADAIRREVPLLKSLSPQVDGSVQVIGAAHNWFTRFRGETPEYLDIKRWEVAEGGSFSDRDVADAAAKALIGKTVRDQLFGELNAVGEIVRINGFPFEVVGVLAPKGQTQYGQDQDDWVLVPYTTAQKKLLGKGHTWLDDILCSAVTPEAVNPAIDQVMALLRQRHHIRAGEEDDFNIRRPDELIKAHIAAAQTLATLLVAIACIALLVGGIGIMNVMLATVAQRTREIGLRMAVGARPLDVQVQFLGEAALLSLGGGALGIALSVGGTYLFGDMLGWEIAIPPEALLLAVGFSVGVGLSFGLYPARRASQMDPIEALRHE
jgi:putative ABC transport system permease protein